MQPICVFDIDLRASVGDALQSWSEFAAPAAAGWVVAFEEVAPRQSRMTLELAVPATPDGIERQLLAFKAFAEEREPEPGERRHASG